MARRRPARSTWSLIVVVYVIVGLVVAFDRGYITTALVKQVFSAVLAVLLWFLVLLGVDLRIS